MRVAYVCTDPGVPVFGNKGCSVHVREVVRALARAGVQVSLFARRFDGPRPADFGDVACHELPRPRSRDVAQREQEVLAVNDELPGLLRAHGPFDLVYERYALFSHAAMDFARAAAVPGILEVNAPLIEEQQRHRGLVDRAAAQRSTHRCFAAAETLIAVSSGVAHYLRRWDVPERNIHVIPNGVDPARFAPDAPALADDVFRVGFVGTLRPWHAVGDLLEAFLALHARHSNVQLVIVGDGPQREHLVARLAAAPAGAAAAVKMTGAVPSERIPGLLASMSAAVAPYSRVADCYFSPLKLFEYLAAGLPVVASRAGQVAEILRHGQTGLLYEPGDTAALARWLDALRGDARLRARLGRAGRSFVLREHTWDRVAERIFAAASVGASVCGT